MIGIIFGAIAFGGAMVGAIQNCASTYGGWKDGIERQKNGTDKTNSYFDYRGVRRDLSTGRAIKVDMAIQHELYGTDTCIRDLKTGEVIRNLSEEERHKWKEKARITGKSVYLVDENGNGYHFADGYAHDRGGDGFCYGIQVKDFKTDETYVLRRLIFPYVCSDGKKKYDYAEFYMTLKGMLVRPTDHTLKLIKNGFKKGSIEEMESFIKEFNEGQKNGGYYAKKYYTFQMKDWRKELKKNHPMYEYNMGIYYCNEDKVNVIE